MKYIFPSQFQSNHLESRFGTYDKLAICQQNISTQQLFQCEKNLKEFLIQLSVPRKTFENINKFELKKIVRIISQTVLMFSVE